MTRFILKDFSLKSQMLIIIMIIININDNYRFILISQKAQPNVHTSWKIWILAFCSLIQWKLENPEKIVCFRWTITTLPPPLYDPTWWWDGKLEHKQTKTTLPQMSCPHQTPNPGCSHYQRRTCHSRPVFSLLMKCRKRK